MAGSNPFWVPLFPSEHEPVPHCLAISIHGHRGDGIKTPTTTWCEAQAGASSGGEPWASHVGIGDVEIQAEAVDTYLCTFPWALMPSAPGRIGVRMGVGMGADGAAGLFPSHRAKPRSEDESQRPDLGVTSRFEDGFLVDPKEPPTPPPRGQRRAVRPGAQQDRSRPRPRESPAERGSPQGGSRSGPVVG